GLGKWEVNLAQVLTAGPEWNQLFKQILTTPRGKYGLDAQPTAASATFPFLANTQPSFFAPLDYNGYNAASGALSGRLALPGAPGGTPTAPFPTFGTGGYGENGEKTLFPPAVFDTQLPTTPAPAASP